jgi:hypothetical protein
LQLKRSLPTARLEFRRKVLFQARFILSRCSEKSVARLSFGEPVRWRVLPFGIGRQLADCRIFPGLFHSGIGRICFDWNRHLPQSQAKRGFLQLARNWLNERRRTMPNKPCARKDQAAEHILAFTFRSKACGRPPQARCTLQFAERVSLLRESATTDDKPWSGC